MKLVSRAFTWPQGRRQQIRFLWRRLPFALILVFVTYSVVTWPEAERERGALRRNWRPFPP